MKLLKNSFPLLLIVYTFLTSCTEVVDVQLKDQQKKVVIEGSISTDMTHCYVQLSRTADYFGNSRPEEITNAIVEIGDGTNLFMFYHAGNGTYIPPSGFKGEAGKTYSLKVIVDNVAYTSSSVLYPMFYVDTNLVIDYRPASGFMSEGYAVTYMSIDTRPELVYTKFEFGQNDTIFDQTIIFSNADIRKNELLPFELPFFRPQSGDSVMLYFYSIEKPVADYINALETLRSGAPGPFRTPPANPPTNIAGGALGYFMAMDEVRIGKKLP